MTIPWTERKKFCIRKTFFAQPVNMSDKIFKVVNFKFVITNKQCLPDSTGTCPQTNNEEWTGFTEEDEQTDGVTKAWLMTCEDSVNDGSVYSAKKHNF